jgi:hypothetical protein
MHADIQVCQVHEGCFSAGTAIKNINIKCLTPLPFLFDHLTERWKTLFDAKFEVLLYDLTSTYFESDPPFPEGDKRKFG